MCDRAGVWVRVRVIAAHWDARLRPPTPFGRSPPSRHVAAGRREGPGGNLAAPAAAATRVRTGLEASRGYRFERAVSFRLAEHARRMAPSPACRKRPFATQADRRRPCLEDGRFPVAGSPGAGYGWPLVGTGLTGRKAARTLESLCFAGSAPGPRCSLSYARLWRAWGRASSKHQPTPTPVRTRPRMSSTTRRHTESKVPGRPPSHPRRSVWSANGLARGGHPLSASLTLRLPSPQYG